MKVGPIELALTKAVDRSHAFLLRQLICDHVTATQSAELFE